MKGHITSSNYSANKTTFILFINHRLVESSSLRKAIEAVYTAYLPKHKSPFIYISIEIASQNIDINVHPTKQEVHFLHETSITEDIQKAIETRLLNINQSRTMYLQTLLPSAPTPSKPVLDAEKSDSNNKSVQPYQMVRTDSRDQKLDAFLRPNVGSQEANNKLPVPEAGANTDTQRKPATVSQPDNLTMTNMPLRQEIRLKSVLSLRKGIEEDCDSALKQIFSDYSFVGCVTRVHSLIQHQTKLLLVNTNKLSQQLFYQIILRDFGNFKALKLSEPASIRELAMMALDSDDGGWIESYGPKDKLVDFIVDLLKSKADMLLDYFALEIDSNGMLVSLPYLLENYFPSFMELPIYILRLSTDVDWDNESECFKSFALVTSHFYAFPKYDDETQATEHDETATEQNHGLETNTPNASGRGTESWKWVTEHIIYTTFRKIFRPPQEDATNGTVLQIANLVDLYKVFERC